MPRGSGESKLQRRSIDAQTLLTLCKKTLIGTHSLQPEILQAYAEKRVR